jgi:hypothetical protein
LTTVSQTPANMADSVPAVHCQATTTVTVLHLMLVLTVKVSNACSGVEVHVVFHILSQISVGLAKF